MDTSEPITVNTDTPVTIGDAAVKFASKLPDIVSEQEICAALQEVDDIIHEQHAELAAAAKEHKNQCAPKKSDIDEDAVLLETHYLRAVLRETRTADKLIQSVRDASQKRMALIQEMLEQRKSKAELDAALARVKNFEFAFAATQETGARHTTSHVAAQPPTAKDLGLTVIIDDRDYISYEPGQSTHVALFCMLWNKIQRLNIHVDTDPTRIRAPAADVCFVDHEDKCVATLQMKSGTDFFKTLRSALHDAGMPTTVDVNQHSVINFPGSKEFKTATIKYRQESVWRAIQ